MEETKIEIDLLLSRCKCCLDDSDLRDLWSEYINQTGEAEIYGKMINECYALPWVPPDDSSTEQICESCISRLKEAYNFKKEILQTVSLLNQVTDMSRVKQESFEDFDYVKAEDIIMEYIEDDNVDGDDDGKVVIQTIPGRDSDGNVVLEVKYGKQEPKSDVYEDVEFLEEDALENKDQDSEIIDDPPSQDEQPKRKWPRKKKRHEKTRTYKNYTESDLRQAVENVKSSEMTLQEASAAYNVPYKTLQLRLKQPDLTPQREKQYKFIEDIKIILTYTNATPFKSRTSRWYCAYCFPDGDFFEEAEDLRTHTRTQHVSDRTKNIDSILRPTWCNEVIKLDIDNLLCTVCCTMISSWNNMFEHLLINHKVKLEEARTRVIPYILGREMKCAVCRELHPSYNHLDVHMNTHYNKYMCQECGEPFLSASRMKIHEKVHVTGTFPCEVCGKIFIRDHYRKKHYDLVHKQEAKIKCLYCTQRFQGEYQRHMHVIESHKEKIQEITCELCGKIFTWRPYYVKHIKRYHSGAYKYECMFCTKKFVLRKERKMHIEVQHKDIRQALKKTTLSDIEKILKENIECDDI